MAVWMRTCCGGVRHAAVHVEGALGTRVHAHELLLAFAREVEARGS